MHVTAKSFAYFLNLEIICKIRKTAIYIGSAVIRKIIAYSEIAETRTDQTFISGHGFGPRISRDSVKQLSGLKKINVKPASTTKVIAKAKIKFLFVYLVIDIFSLISQYTDLYSTFKDASMESNAVDIIESIDVSAIIVSWSVLSSTRSIKANLELSDFPESTHLFAIV